jgi:hypothetical protein
MALSRRSHHWGCAGHEKTEALCFKIAEVVIIANEEGLETKIFVCVNKKPAAKFLFLRLPALGAGGLSFQDDLLPEVPALGVQ